MEVLKSAVQEIMKEIYKEGMTFKITSKRSDHNFELDSRELNQTLGGAVFRGHSKRASSDEKSRY